MVLADALESRRAGFHRALLLGLNQDSMRDLAAALEGQHDLLSAETTWRRHGACSRARALGPPLEFAAWTAYARDGR